MDLCPCCYCESDSWVSISSCGHFLCQDCYTGYLISKVNDGQECVFAICPDQKCNMIVPDKLFRQLIDSIIYKKY